MSKAIITMGYRSIVLDTEDAVKVVNLLASGELYEDKYHSAVDGKQGYNTHHIYPMESMRAAVDLRLLSNEEYRMYKMAGKPEK